MKIKIAVIVFINLMFIAVGWGPVYALVHSQKKGLFSMDVPAQWRWFEYPKEIIITYPDGKTMAIDIQMVASKNLSQTDIKRTLKEGNDKMIKDGIEAHNGVLIGNKEITLDGVYARRLDFETVIPSTVYVTYVSFFNKGYAFTITYGTEDDKMHSVMDDALATIKLR